MHVIGKLNVWLEPFKMPVGTLSLNGEGALSFEYSNDYLCTDGAMPISLALPLTKTKYGDVQTRTFFGNLTPEGFQAKTVESYFSVSPHDIFGLLQRLGGDCSGAMLCVSSKTSRPNYPFKFPKDYTHIPGADIEDAVSSLRRGATPESGLGSSSLLAGAQEKISLVHTKSRDHAFWRASKRGAPSTHFIKVPKDDDEHSATLEPLFSQLAAKLGINVAKVTQLTIGGTPCTLVERYDRKIFSDGSMKRIHTEDMAQASSIPGLLKYERNGLSHRRFAATTFGNVLAQTKDPKKDRSELFLLTVFNVAIGNTDNHAKNHSLIHIEGSKPQLAPAYDLLPTSYLPPNMQELAFRIGNAKFLDDIELEDWILFARDIGILSETEARGLAAGPGSSLLKALNDQLAVTLMPEYDALCSTINARISRTLSQFQAAEAAK